jgi:hypothetical protein
MRTSTVLQPGQKIMKPEEAKNVLDIRDLIARFRSKRDLYDYLLYQSKPYSNYVNQKIGQYFLPARKKVTKDFLKLVFAGKKELIPQS